MKKIKIISITILSILVLEILSRLFFPQFNQSLIVYSDDNKNRVSLGIKGYYENLDNLNKKFFFRYDPKNRVLVDNSKKNIFFIGDSVTWGYGVEFNDTYYLQFKKKIISNDINVHAGSNMGTSYSENLNFIKNDLLKLLKPDDIVIYQFNYNDITPYDSEDIKIKQNTFLQKSFRTFQKFRYKYLNHSHLIKTMGYYSSLYANLPKKNLTCKEKGIKSLGMYTYTFFSEGFNDQSQKLWNDFEGKLLNLNETLIKKNINFIVLISPISLQITNHNDNNKYKLDLSCSDQNPHEYLISMLRKKSVKFIDPTNKFKSVSNKNIKLFHSFDTNHPNKFGHKIIGEIIYKDLNEYN